MDDLERKIWNRLELIEGVLGNLIGNGISWASNSEIATEDGKIVNNTLNIITLDERITNLENDENVTDDFVVGSSFDQLMALAAPGNQTINFQRSGAYTLVGNQKYGNNGGANVAYTNIILNGNGASLTISHPSFNSVPNNLLFKNWTFKNFSSLNLNVGANIGYFQSPLFIGCGMVQYFDNSLHSSYPNVYDNCTFTPSWVPNCYDIYKNCVYYSNVMNNYNLVAGIGILYFINCSFISNSGVFDLYVSTSPGVGLACMFQNCYFLGVRFHSDFNAGIRMVGCYWDNSNTTNLFWGSQLGDWRFSGCYISCTAYTLCTGSFSVTNMIFNGCELSLLNDSNITSFTGDYKAIGCHIKTAATLNLNTTQSTVDTN